MIRKLLAGIVCLITGCRDAEDVSSAVVTASEVTEDAWIEELVWRKETDEMNPFDHEVLDCRAVALGFTATTSVKSIAESFNRLRLDDGKSCIGTLPKINFTVEADLRFPYNGNREDGVIFAAREMEDKWDFYVYDSYLYIRRSWTGVLVHVAELRYSDSEVIIKKIHSDRETVFGDPEFAKAHLRFLITTHFGSNAMPFPIAPDVPRYERKTIALMGFNTYGRRAQFASYLNNQGEQDGGGQPATPYETK